MLVPLVLGAPQEPSQKELVKSLEARYARSSALRAVFEERYYENGRLLRMEAGSVRFRRPGKMRWDYSIPESKLFVSDGRTVWLYVPADRTATRSVVKDTSDWRMPFALLTRSPKLARLCESVTAGDASEASRPGRAVLHCRPRDPGGEGRQQGEILIEADPRSGELSRVKVDTGGGTALEFFFSQWTDDAGSPDSQFRFEPPAGVAIVNAPTDQSTIGTPDIL